MTRPRIYTLFVFIVGLLLVSEVNSTANEQFRNALVQLEQVTGRSFKEDVSLQQQSRGEFLEFVKQELHNTYPGNQLRNTGRIYQLMGLIPLDYHVEREIPELYTEQVGAYYDPETGTIFQVSNQLSKAARRFIYLHEGVHALQDQYYDLEKMQQNVAEESTLDRRLAFNFVIEGHANLIATAAQMRANRLDRHFFQSGRLLRVFQLMARLTDLNADQFQAITRLFGELESPFARSLGNLQDIPLILVQQLPDPYLTGQLIWFRQARLEGLSRAERWLRTVPRSTSELLYDKKQPGIRESRGSNLPGEYQDQLGSYMLMRWLKKFRKRPEWSKHIVSDRASILRDGSDEALALRIKFTSRRFRESFRSRLIDLSRVPEDKNDHQIPYRVFERNSRRRYMWLTGDRQSIVVFLNDDTEIRNELRSYDRSFDTFSKPLRN